MAIEVTYWPFVLSNGIRMTGSPDGGNGNIHRTELGKLRGTTASEMPPLGKNTRNEACPRTLPVVLMLAQPWIVMGSEVESTTLCEPPGGIAKG